MYGMNLLSGSTSTSLVNTARVSSGSCSQLSSSNATTVLCRLPDPEALDSVGFAEGDTVVIYYQQSFSAGAVSWNKFGNLTTFTVTYDPLPEPAPTAEPSDASSVNVAAIVAAIVVVVVGVVVLAAVWVWHRRRVGGRSSQHAATDGGRELKWWDSKASDSEGVELR